MRFTSIISLFVIGLSISLSAVYAGDVFNVDKVSIKAEAASTTQARALAIETGQKHALDIVLKRISLQEQWHLLPDLETTNIADYVRAFQLGSERSSERTYSAEINVTFKPDALRQWLDRLQLSITETQAPTALLLPIIHDGQKFNLWDQHWWWQALEKQDLVNNNLPLVLPIGDLEETTYIDVDRLVSGDIELLDFIRQRYGAAQIIIAYSQAAPNQLDTALYIYRHEKETNRLDLADILRFRETDNSRSALADQAAIRLLQILANDWKTLSAVNNNQNTNITLDVYYDSLPEWFTLQNQIKKADFVRGFELENIMSDHSTLTLNFVGSYNQLRLGLEKIGLVLTAPTTATQHWQLKKREDHLPLAPFIQTGENEAS